MEKLLNMYKKIAEMADAAGAECTEASNKLLGYHFADTPVYRDLLNDFTAKSARYSALVECMSILLEEFTNDN